MTSHTAQWSKEKCKRFSETTRSDAFGTKYPFPGYFPVHNPNGIYKDVLPKVHEDYEFIHVPFWGFRLVKKDKTC